MREFLVAVDVGTGSARVGVFTVKGALLSRVAHPISMSRPQENHAEHQSEEIWRVVCRCVREALDIAKVTAGQVAAIGFDATCSLVVRGKKGEPVTVSVTGEDRFDTIVWLDHRALAQSDFLSASGHPVLEFSGQSISPEMQIPKLMWLKQQMPETWQRSGYFFDLADFLTWKASGSANRSLCTLTAKWNFLAHDGGWSEDYLAMAGLEDLLSRGGLPSSAIGPGTSVGFVSAEAAQQLGLDTGCKVAAGMIDAYAGALGALGGCLKDDIEQHAALIAGTSSCLVAFTEKPKPGHSLWGPYWDCVLPGHWLVEGGQSVSGGLLDYIVQMHAAGGKPETGLHQRIEQRVQQLRVKEGAEFGSRLHVLPDFHGNRSPLADPHALGVVSGLTLDMSFDGLCRLYWRTAVSIALGTRHILEAMEDTGYHIDTLHVTGGHVHSRLLMELYADVTGRNIVMSKTVDAVLLGTAMTAASAGGVHADLFAAGKAMHSAGEMLRPNPGLTGGYDRDYRRFMAMQRHREELESL